MRSSQSPRKVLKTAWRLGKRCLPDYASKFSRKDFTLPQLFACLVLRQFYNLSYRRTQALLQDCPGWRRAIGLKRTPDHNTLCDAFGTLTAMPVVQEMLDELARAFGAAGLLDLENNPLTIDSTYYESHHVSRHYEKRKRSKEADSSGDPARSRVVRSLPKLAIAVAAGCHLILSAWTGTGLGSDHPHFEPLLFDAWRRAEVRCVVADAGYDSEKSHRLARLDMGIESIIPPWIGRPTHHAPPTRFRAEMAQLFAAQTTPQPYGQRWQVETANSMMKRNFGSALRARSPQRREREMMLKVLTHNIAL